MTVNKNESLLPKTDGDSGESLADMGSEVRGLRQAQGLTLAALANATGLSVGFLSKI